MISPENRIAHLPTRRVAIASVAIIAATVPMAGVLLEQRKRKKEDQILKVNSGDYGDIPANPTRK